MLTTGLVSQILDELNNNDILLRMNILGLLTQLGLSRHGYTFLETSGVLNKMFLMFEDSEDPITVQLCEPGNKVMFILLQTSIFQIPFQVF